MNFVESIGFVYTNRVIAMCFLAKQNSLTLYMNIVESMCGISKVTLIGHKMLDFIVNQL